MCPGASIPCRAFPKRKSRSIPSIHAADWGCSLTLWPKIEHISLNSRPFEAAFSGISHVLHFAGDSIFFEFYFANFVAALFEPATKFITIESDVISGTVGPPGKPPSSGMAVGELSHDRCRIPSFGRLIDRNSDTTQSINNSFIWVLYDYK